MRTRYPVTVHLFFFDQGRVLLLRRANTGFADGQYSLVAGHVDNQERILEAAIREASEEVGVKLVAEDLQIVQVMQRKSDEVRIDYFLQVQHWQGAIRNAEPDKCDHLAWFDLHALPENTIPYIRQALKNYQAQVYFSEFGW